MGTKKKCTAEEAADKVFAALRKGKSLFTACACAGINTYDFYTLMTSNRKSRESYLLALADYADRCTDGIREIIASLKAGELDTSTAKLLIETEKWLAQKACPEPIWDKISGEDENGSSAEIIVKFV